MSPEPEVPGWDFTPVIKLIHSLSATSDLRPKSGHGEQPIKPSGATLTSRDPNSPILGNFDRLWQELGKPCDLPPPTIDKRPSPDRKPSHADTTLLRLDEYLPHSKGVRWRDEDGIADLEDSDGANDMGRASPLVTRKREKAVKSKLGAKAGDGLVPSDFESETDLRNLRESPTRDSTKALSTSINAVADGLEESELSSASPPRHSILKARNEWPTSNPALWKPNPYRIEPLSKISPAERKAKLVMKLVDAFPGESSHLLDLARSQRKQTTARDPRQELHVFVDCSNIMIGFFDTLKAARGIPETAYTRRVPMSFHSLALILERGRPAVKRVLVGSKPLVPAMQEAQDCGYQTNILDRVRKARDITPRRKKGHNSGSGNVTSGQSSGSETIGPQRMVEQGVDEILHLKILESLVDAKEPATIVLATGDAAQAEYSEGFMRMVERALDKGWRVELASFTQNLSFAYRKRDFKQAWSGRFKIIELDDYSEELSDM